MKRGIVTWPRHRGTRSIIAVASVLVTAGALGACSSEDPDPVDSPSALSGLPSPVIVDLDDLDGGTFTITADRPLVINGTDDGEWTGSTEDTDVATFSTADTATEDQSATFNVGFDAVGEGTTGAELTGPSGETDTFTIVVESAS